MLREEYRFQYLEVAHPRARVLLGYAATVRYCPTHLGHGAGTG